MSRLIPPCIFLLSLSPMFAWADTPVDARQPVNVAAIITFVLFVLSTLLITWWAARRTHSRKEFYVAGGDISAWQNGIAISGDFMSAATFLGLTSLLFFAGTDGLMLAVGAVASWPVILFLMAERLRNLGRYTFIDVISFRLAATPDYTGCGTGLPRHRGLLSYLAACGSGKIDPVAVRSGLHLGR